MEFGLLEITEANRSVRNQDFLDKDGLDTEGSWLWATILFCAGEWCRNHTVSVLRDCSPRWPALEFTVKASGEG